jgi:hypothetical protein
VVANRPQVTATNSRAAKTLATTSSTTAAPTTTTTTTGGGGGVAAISYRKPGHSRRAAVVAPVPANHVAPNVTASHVVAVGLNNASSSSSLSSSLPSIPRTTSDPAVLTMGTASSISASPSSRSISPSPTSILWQRAADAVKRKEAEAVVARSLSNGNLDTVIHHTSIVNVATVVTPAIPVRVTPTPAAVVTTSTGSHGVNMSPRPNNTISSVSMVPETPVTKPIASATASSGNARPLPHLQSIVIPPSPVPMESITSSSLLRSPPPQLASPPRSFSSPATNSTSPLVVPHQSLPLSPKSSSLDPTMNERISNNNHFIANHSPTDILIPDTPAPAIASSCVPLPSSSSIHTPAQSKKRPRPSTPIATPITVATPTTTTTITTLPVHVQSSEVDNTLATTNVQATIPTISISSVSSVASPPTMDATVAAETEGIDMEAVFGRAIIETSWKRTRVEPGRSFVVQQRGTTSLPPPPPQQHQQFQRPLSSTLSIPSPSPLSLSVSNTILSSTSSTSSTQSSFFSSRWMDPPTPSISPMSATSDQPQQMPSLLQSSSLSTSVATPIVVRPSPLPASTRSVSSFVSPSLSVIAPSISHHKIDADPTKTLPSNNGSIRGPPSLIPPLSSNTATTVSGVNDEEDSMMDDPDSFDEAIVAAAEQQAMTLLAAGNSNGNETKQSSITSSSIVPPAKKGRRGRRRAAPKPTVTLATSNLNLQHDVTAMTHWLPEDICAKYAKHTGIKTLYEWQAACINQPEVPSISTRLNSTLTHYCVITRDNSH